MKAKEVLDLLQITRPTLCKYVKQGLIKVDAVISRTNIPDNSGENNPRYGKPNPRKGLKTSGESIVKLKQTLHELYKDLHRIWINDGEKEKLHNIELPIPEGFTKGRIYKTRKDV